MPRSWLKNRQKQKIFKEHFNIYSYIYLKIRKIRLIQALPCANKIKTRPRWCGPRAGSAVSSGQVWWGLGAGHVGGQGDKPPLEKQRGLAAGGREEKVKE